MSHENETIEYSIEADDAGERLDKFLVERLAEFSRSQIQAMIKALAIKVNGKASKASYRLESRDQILVDIPPPSAGNVSPEDIPLVVIYEDEAIAVINKPAGMVVHPGHGNESGTLVNALLARWPQVADVGDERVRAGIVHRLDKDTSGLIAVALTEAAREDLVRQFQARAVEKHYLALVERHPDNDRGRIEAPIGRNPRQRKQMAVQRDGKEATTEFYVRTFYGERALLDVHPLTGRTHQIRVHLAFIGCPIVGDDVYGYRKQRFKLKRLFLHAYRLGFDHPLTHRRLEFEAPLPSGLQNILDKLSTS
ncbi:MAG: RluA family pseudouridine synthase [Chloroflexi bacterium]|nr:RluA family pseudouridine synthase [Chloroflexota bacterium]